MARAVDGYQPTAWDLVGSGYFKKLYSKEIFSSLMQSSSSSTTYPSKSMRSIKDYLCQDTIHPSNTNRAWRWISSWKYISISVKYRLFDLVSCQVHGMGRGRGQIRSIIRVHCHAYLLFVTDTTDSVCVKKIARCIFLQI